MKSGLYAGVPDAEYRGLPSLSFSDLADFVDAPRKLSANKANIGLAVHTALLEKDAWSQRFRTAGKDFDRRTVEGKAYAEKELISTCLYGKVPDPAPVLLKPKEVALVARMCTAIRTDDNYKWVMDHRDPWPMTEATLIGDILPGHKSKGRLDLLLTSAPMIADIKTTGYLDQSDMLLSIGNYRYAAQMAYYQDLYRTVHPDQNIPPVYIFFISKKPPHKIVTHRMEDHLLAMGRAWYRDVYRLRCRMYEDIAGHIADAVARIPSSGTEQSAELMKEPDNGQAVRT